MAYAEFTPDENTVTLDGHRYVAQDTATPGWCHGCTMKAGFGCALAAAVYGQGSDAEGPRCAPHQRKDGRHVTWARSGGRAR